MYSEGRIFGKKIIKRENVKAALSFHSINLFIIVVTLIHVTLLFPRIQRKGVLMCESGRLFVLALTLYQRESVRLWQERQKDNKKNSKNKKL